MTKNKNYDKGQVAPFPFDKMFYQEKGGSVDELNDYDRGQQELDLGDERGAGHEP
ncbi:Uncharacterized protein NEOC65_000721 [Neochlamydia sp. AcF65]|uniref:hypothetical protein n=1 Tax=unclassified Neochlamydia TaxID=2643326 RepID=UPI0014072EB9|nr:MULTISPECIES: hypothetical protein [unclassified Neochlamydia]MBS4165656.1 Uncharacterized protein [Neochlamydia sp. AcF65]NGY95359.1 hypothetical protein [Neochlamydia sp. AcF84]